MRIIDTLPLAFTCIVGAHALPTHQDQAVRMLESIRDRGQALLTSTAGTGLIQIGIFWQALATVTGSGPSSSVKDALKPLLYESLASTLPVVSNTSKDVTLPLDRFSLGADMLSWQLRTHNDSFLPTIRALNDSVDLQPRNANGGLWYYDNLNNLTAYQNLSYLDGMFSFAPFVTLESRNAEYPATEDSIQSALEQLQILYDICKKPSGLLVHGYDAIKAHAWANTTTGASPEVWGRSLAWYSLGLLNTLEAAASESDAVVCEPHKKLRSLFQDVMDAQVQAARRSKATTGLSGVWQVVDRPGGNGNFIEASSSFLTSYILLRGTRLNLLEDSVSNDGRGDRGSEGYRPLAAEIYNTVSQQYLITHSNGSLSLNGTSSIASLSGQNVSYEYYVTRPKEMDSVLGTSAFVLASHEMAQL